MNPAISVKVQPIPIAWNMSSRKATTIAENAYRTRLVDALAAEGARWLMSTSKVLKVCSHMSEPLCKMLCLEAEFLNTYTKVDLHGHSCEELKHHGYCYML